MSLFDKLFRRNTKSEQEKVVEAILAAEKARAAKASVSANVEKNIETQVSNDVSKQEEKKSYIFKFMLTDEETQKRVLDYVRPITSDLDIINLQLVYGVKEQESGLLLLRRKSSQRRDGQTGQTYYTTHFLALTQDKICDVSYTTDNLRDEGNLTYDIPSEQEDIIKQALNFWRNWPAHKEFERACSEATPGFVISKLNNELCKPLRKELKVYQEEQEKLKASQKKHMEMTCEEDAKQLFFLCNTDCHRKMKEDYDVATVKAFEQYGSREKKQEWVIEECSHILQNIIDGDREKIYEKLEKVDGRCRYWLAAESEQLVPLYTKACEVLWESGEERFVVCIHSFLQNLKNSMNPACVAELLDRTEKYYIEKYPQEYERGGIASHPGKFKQICCELRSRMRELAPSENIRGFRFVLTNQEDLRNIILWYRNKYNDDTAVKESVAELNCAYGVENDEVFLAALDDVADQSMLQSWDRFSFVGILRATGEVMEVRCKRELADGGFVRDYCAGPVKEHWELLTDAMEYYRNRSARKAFFEAYEKEYGEDILKLKAEARKGLLTKFKRHYEKEYKRTSGNPLAKQLVQLIDLCEERGGAYGYKNTVFGKPATAEEIEAWENTHGLCLPQDYKQFLQFANGGHFFGDSESIFGLQGLREQDEFLEADYIHLGNMIGDGTMICMSKSSGKVYIMDHGEYEDKGTFEDFLEYFVDFLSGF